MHQQQISDAHIPDASLIIPVFNSEAALRRLFENISELSGSSSFNIEVVFVDDGSVDNTVGLLRELQVHTSNIAIVEHAINRGQAKATLTGIAAARHDIVVTLDDDLQHRPQEIPRLVDALANSCPSTLVMGINDSMKRPLWRAMVGICCNLISNLFLAKPLPLRLTTFCAFRRQLCAHIDPDADRDIALITELVQAADQTIIVPVQADVSPQRGSRYTFAALVRLFVSRSNCYRLSRVLLCFACTLLATGASIALLVTTGALAYAAIALASAVASLLSALLMIKLKRHS